MTLRFGQMRKLPDALVQSPTLADQIGTRAERTQAVNAIAEEGRTGEVRLLAAKSDLPVQSPSQKYFHSLLTQITCISLAVPSHTEGRFAIVTDAGRDAVDAGGALTKALAADGEVVWS